MATWSLFVNRLAAMVIINCFLYAVQYHGKYVFLFELSFFIILSLQLNMTPLHWACEHNHVDIAKILLQAGARHDIKSKVRLIVQGSKLHLS